MKLYKENLYENLLLNPPDEAKHLFLLSGYATSAMLDLHLNDLSNISIHMIIGMVSKDGISKVDHIKFNDLMLNHKDRVECLYNIRGNPAHSKCYIWCDEKKKPLVAYMGSANYTQKAFISNEQNELMCEFSASELWKYFNLFYESKDVYFCNHPAVDGFVKDTYYKSNLDIQNNPNDDSVTLSLLTSKGEVGTTSGINWGQRDGRDKNQAYIPIRSEIQKSNFFPDRKIQFTVLTDDGQSMILVRAQDNGKALHSNPSNSILGEYIRKRIGVNDKAFVTKEDFEKYGRSDITFTKIDDETYYMDFSVKKY
ncbi:restriction endonuclease PLD domain-containing protein [Brachyspira hyodysenteriae]|nr:restriction endonuclease PLD domain-containing protein [Brachyspira hyodysenteriae]MCZ9849676.1 NgoFVII family restriction endonuclease [Brachyspira hyodysenteriae]MCZ9852489.1 NgoFVII family restriction endonuclease [Brachyspira hyodysenteriae]MCZ9862160.1 NgoFVII family restriction endonuclease [Brachyspira hyodysenteriae]MCZ9871565.1 NgoFVII family restriction endonuclease [Brachyspira hyodysenteriae]MCZ9895319.1 NgoFVII family restriction endonuclease [Brachyspira hyodysenteriae]